MNAPTGGPNLISALQSYITKMIEVPGMKALLLDKETTPIVSLVYSQSQIIAQEVFLVERIDQDIVPPRPIQQGGSIAPEVSMHHLKAVVFVRPTMLSIGSLKAQLKKPKYKEYHVFFSNVCKEEFLKSLAESDEFEVVRQVQEYYGDFYAVNPDLFHLNLFHTKCLQQGENFWTERDRGLWRRNCDGILSALLALKRRPAVRYARSSELARKTAQEVGRRIKEENDLFHFGGNTGSPLLLILDRRDDPVTPLLLQWHYQAMVHELIPGGLKNNRVDLSSAPHIRKELKEVVLSCDQDRFFRGQMHANFGDLGSAVKELVETYSAKVKSNQRIATIEDMQRFVDQYPDFKSLSGNVSKHVAIMTELTRLLDSRDLYSVSELEQELACGNDHGAALERVLKMFENPRLSDHDRLRLTLLYAIKYEQQKNNIQTLKSLYRDKASDDLSRKRIVAVDALLTYAGQAVRMDQSSVTGKLLDRVRGLLGSGLRGVENVYTQHKPALSYILDALLKRSLKTSLYPYIDGTPESKAHDDIFIFIIGGVTFEEADAVFNFNKDNDVRFFLGGSCIHNSTTFIEDILSDSAVDLDDFKETDLR